MTSLGLLKRNLRHYWRTNLAVVAGTAIAVSVMTGALLVGESVRTSLRNMVVERIGRTQSVVLSASFFREALGSEIAASATPLIALEGIAANGERRASGIGVYGVDDRFWRFHQKQAPSLESREMWISAALAAELGAKPGDLVLIRFEKPSQIPAEWLHGRKEDASRAVRFNVKGILPADRMGDFSLRPSQADVRAAFVPLSTLQRELEQRGKVNTILLDGPAPAGWQSKVTLEDLGIRVRELAESLSIENSGALIGDSLASAIAKTASELGLRRMPVFTYVVNSIHIGSREIPYSLVTAIDLAELEEDEIKGSVIFLNEWAARDLRARPGENVALDFYVWRENGQLDTERATFEFERSLPMSGLAVDRDLAPEYPGLTDSDTLHDWDPPFPIDLERIRDVDEEYWKEYRTAPKAFIALTEGQALWKSRFGKLTSVRIEPKEQSAAFQARLRAALDPEQFGLSELPVRTQNLSAAQGATDFGEYFFYFSFFLVVAALMLAGMFFRLGVEQRLREIGILTALGFTRAGVRRVFLREGFLLATVGAMLGTAGALAYAAFILTGLSTWWRDAVNTSRLSLAVSPIPFAAGLLGGVLIALVWIWFTLRGIRHLSARSLLSGSHEPSLAPPAGWRRGANLTIVAVGLLGALGLIVASGLGRIPPAGAFFGSAGLLLAALLSLMWLWLIRQPKAPVAHTGQLGLRNVAFRRGRSLLCITLIALATFLICSLESFRREGAEPASKKSGAGGYALIAESSLPVFYDLDTVEGRDQYNLSGLPEGRITAFRLKPGEDASCLNLYSPRNPRVAGVTQSFMREGRFRFQSSLADTPREKENPWLLLDRGETDNAIPAIVDANSLAYVLHRKLGDVITVDDGHGAPVRLKLVAALQDSIFQSELLISAPRFQKAFPYEQGFRYFLIDTPDPGRMTSALENGLTDFGFDAQFAGDRLAAFHRVENAYLSTFQALGGLGLLLGTAGLAVILIRNVLEAQRQYALLQAVGYQFADLAKVVIVENLVLLVCGLTAGAICALVAVFPVLSDRGSMRPLLSLVILLPLVLAVGLSASLGAVRVLRRQNLISTLRAE